MDIEFIVQDVFSLTRPQWKLASNYEEASRAFQLAVAQDQKTSGADKLTEPIDVDSESSDDGMDEAEADAEAEAEAEADAGLAGVDGEDDSETDEEAEVSPQTANSSGFGPLTSVKLDAPGDANAVTPTTDSEDESIVVTRQEEEVDPEDEADFEREYAKMMAESLESRKHERKSTFDVPLPMRRKDRDINSTSDTWPDETASPNIAASGTMAFSLLTKRGNRQQVRVPVIID
jgi:regulator of nonsense transcripts 2